MAEHVTIKEKDFSRGIDARSAETEIAPGYVEDAVNVDVAQGRLKKRLGYGHFASLPVSVKAVIANKDTNQIELTLPESVDLSGIPSVPLLLYGSVDTADADWDLTTSSSWTYYEAATPTITTILPYPYVAPVVAPTYQFSTDLFSAYVTEKTVSGNSTFDVNSISIDQMDLSVIVDYTPTDDDITSYIYYVDRSTSNISSHTVADEGTRTITIAGSSWNPDTTNIGIEVWQDTGSEFIRVLPDEAKITDTSSGDVSITLDIGDETGSDVTYRVVLTAIPETNTGSFNLQGPSVLSPDGSYVINIPNASTPYLVPYVYVSTSGGGILSLCEVESIEYDAATNSHNITVINVDVNTAYSLTYFWEYGNIVANRLVVANKASVSPSASHTYNEFQLAIYGLLPANIYGAEGAGYVNHIDGYIKEGVAAAVSSIHGNIYAEEDKEDTTLPALYACLFGRTASDNTVGPAFQQAASSRTRGDVVSSSVDLTNSLPCVSAEFVSYNTVKYTLTAVANIVSGTPIIAGDLLSVSQMGFSQLDGDFVVLSVVYNTDTIEIVVVNENIIDSSYDDTSAGGFAAVYTDSIPLSTSSGLPGAKYFLPGDVFTSSGLEQFQTSVAAISGDVLIVNGLTQLTQLAIGTKVTGSRASALVPLRSSVYAQDVDYIVAGDVVETDKLVTYVNARSDEVISASGDILTVADTSYFVPGTQLLLARDGMYTVEGVISTTTLQLDREPAQGTGLLLGKYIVLDQEIEYNDCSKCAVEVERRLFPVVAPSVSGTNDLTTNKAPTYLPATPDSGSLPLRSTMVADNMYFVDGSNQPLKFDGTNALRPSLPNFNPIYSTRFVADANGSFGKTATSTFSPTKGYFESTTAQKITVLTDSTFKPSDVLNFNPGDYIRIYNATYAPNGIVLQVTNTEVVSIDTAITSGITVPSDTGSGSPNTTVKCGYIYLSDIPVFSGTPTYSDKFTISRVFTYKYYARLNYLDANRNIIASAAQGYFDTIVTQAEPGVVKFKFIQPPVFDLYDYDRLELELYRTQGDGAVFFKIVTLSLNFASGLPYIEFTDTVRDSDLSEIDPTSVPINGEVGTTFHGLPIAKHITSINNSLVVGNITGEASLAINVEKINASASVSDFSGAYVTFKEDNSDVASRQFTFEFVSSIAWSLAASKFSQTGGEVAIDTTSAHGLSIGDWVYITFYASDVEETASPLIGWWQVVDNTTTQFTITCSADLSAFIATSTEKVSIIKASASSRVPVYTGTDSAYSVSVGNSSTFLISLMYRLSQAINATQRATDKSIPGQENFVPWAHAAHNAQRAGGLTLTAARYISSVMSLSFPNLGANASKYEWYANGVRWTSGASLSQQLQYPSRLLASYQNYPEMFDNIYAVQPDDSDSVIDINPADGQEITGIIPFFGDTAFGAAMRGGVLVVFKQNSIYLVDLAVKDQGVNPVQKLATNGIGCAYPRSIAVSKDAIFFAHRSGIYALRRDQTVQPIGKLVERLFEVGDFSDSHAHHSSNDKKYVIAYDTNGSGRDNGHLVYNHSQEEEGQLGAWTRYEGHFATGWANLNSEELFSSDKGELMAVSRTGTTSDFSDIGGAITSTLLFRIMDFGDSGVRKQVRHVFSHFRPVTSLTNIALYVAVDGDTSFASTDEFEIVKGGIGNAVALTGTKKVITLGHSLPSERALYFQIKLVDSGLNEAIDLIGLDYTVLGLSHHGITEASSTKK